MGDHNTAGEVALVRAVRALDQDDFDSLPDRLERIWDTLSGYSGGNFHAAEEMLVRWLLKNMTGTTENAERVRRFPRTWDILGAVFSLIPLFSLAKSLADRRFVPILQQTLKDIASPQDGTQPAKEANSDTDMADEPAPQSPANPRKRKRPSSGFDLATRRQPGACLETAEAVFDAVTTLLARCEMLSVDKPTMQRMGAEHVKSLFSSAASEAMDILAPWLTVCGLALDRPSVSGETIGNQSSWLSTFSALWDLHIQSAGDASEVATHLSGTALKLLGKLMGIPRQTALSVDTVVRDRWTRDLRRFLMRNLILPARAAFLTRDSREVIEVTVAMASASAQISFPVLFDLASRIPVEFGGKTSKKDYETWIQAVFDAILHACKNVNRQNAQSAVRTIMDMAAEKNIALSAASLRTLCQDYALRSGAETHDWSLLLSLIKLNPDVFLVSEEGKQLLDKVLEKTRDADSFSPEEFERAARFIVLLADGYAQARELSTFVHLWLKHLAPAKAKRPLQPLWAQRELADTVARLIQSSLNTNQLVDLLDWLASQAQPAEALARIHVIEAISNGVSLEEYVDIANMKAFDVAFAEKYSKKESAPIAACRWTVAAKTIARGTLDEANRVWGQIRSDVKNVLKKGAVERQDTFAAFRCCVAAWLANHPGGENEEDAAKLVCGFVERLEKEEKEEKEKEEEEEGMKVDSVEGGVKKGVYWDWILADAPRLLSLFLEKRDSIPASILALVTAHGREDGNTGPATCVARLLLDRESNVNNQKLMDSLLETMISLVDTSKSGKTGNATKIAIQFLLDTPIETLSRPQREAIMKALVAHLPEESDKVKTIGPEYWRPVLSLMVKLMSRPTFYEGMNFSHLNAIGRCLLEEYKRSNRLSREGLTDDASRNEDLFQLFYQLAVLTIRQMANANIEEREKVYLRGASSLLQSPCQGSEVIARLILLQAFLTGVQEPAVKKLEEEDVSLAQIRKTLVQTASPVIMTKKKHTKELLTLLTALTAVSTLDREAVREAFSGAVPSLLETSDNLLGNGMQAGWEVRMFLANYFPEALVSPLKATKAAAPEKLEGGDGEKAEASLAGPTLGKLSLLRYVDAVVRGADETQKLEYLRELLLEEEGQGALGRLLVIYRLIQHLKGTGPSQDQSCFDLSQAHTLLCKRLLPSLPRPSHLALLFKSIHLILDQNPTCMTQWNIDHTLSTVACTAVHANATHTAYPHLCRLVEMVLKRHRKRLDGHFHNLLAALGGLLKLLLTKPPPAEEENIAGTDGAKDLWEKHARLFARLLTLVCEPTVASVTRSSGPGTVIATTTHTHEGDDGEEGNNNASGANAVMLGPLDSEKDRARRYAGQYMYTVVMQYIRLQLDTSAKRRVITHRVREALESGMYSVLDVTTQDGLRILNDGLDGSGRVVFKELYKRYQRFGKWSGV